MNKASIVFIINPIAGGKNAIDKEQIKRIFSDREIIFIENFDGREQNIRKLINDGIRDFVVVGGDGTVNDIASILMNTEARLGIIPTGSGNGLARDLGLPMDIREALEVVKSGKERIIDVGTLNEIPFFCTAGIGFDAICAYDFAHEKHKRGLWNYVRIILRNYFSFESIAVSEGGQKKEIFSMTFANAEQFGNNAYIAPYASLDDGFLECSVIFPHPKLWGLKLALDLMTKKLLGFRYYVSKKIISLKVNGISDSRAHIDGESIEIEGDSIEVGIVRKALKVIVKNEEK